MKITLNMIEMSILKKLLLCLAIICSIFNSYAATVNVVSISALQIAINNGKSGDIIILADGANQIAQIRLGRRQCNLLARALYFG